MVFKGGRLTQRRLELPTLISLAAFFLLFVSVVIELKINGGMACHLFTGKTLEQMSLP